MESLLKRIIIFLGFLIITLFVILSFFAYPHADDNRGFSKDKRVHSFRDSFDYSMNKYKTWEGRYIHYFLIKYYPSLYYKIGIKDDNTIVKINAFIQMTLTLLMSFLIFRLFFKDSVVLYHFLLYLLLFLLNFVNIVETVYWFTGSIGYIFGWILLCLIIHINEIKNIKYNFTFLVLNSILIFFTSGIHFPFSIMLVIYFFISFMINTYKKKNYKNIQLYFLTLSISLFLFAFLAPGNFNRMETVARLYGNQRHFDFNLLFILKEWIGNTFVNNLILNLFGSTVILSFFIALLISLVAKINMENTYKIFFFSFFSTIAYQLFLNVSFSTHKHIYFHQRTGFWFTILSPLLFTSFYLIILNKLFQYRNKFKITLKKYMNALLIITIISILSVTPFNFIKNIINHGYSEIDKTIKKSNLYFKYRDF